MRIWMGVWVIFLFVFMATACFAADKKEENAAVKLAKIIKELLPEQVEKLSTQINALESKKSKLEKEIINFKQREEKSLAENKAINKKNVELGNTIAGLKTDISSLSSAKQSVESANNVLTDKINALTEEIQDKFLLEFEKSSLQKKVEILNNDLNKTELERHKWLINCQYLQKELGHVKKEMANAYYNLGVALQRENKFEGAIINYEKVLELNPDDIETQYNLALIYDSVKNDKEKAGYYYKRYLKLNPEAEDALQIEERIAGIEKYILKLRGY